MPYIPEYYRQFYDNPLVELCDKLEQYDYEAGHVNYVIYRIILAWFKSKKKYLTICKIMGTLQCVASEFYRRHAAPYEDEAMNNNGDIGS